MPPIDVQQLIAILTGQQPQSMIPGTPGTGQNMNLNLLAALAGRAGITPSTISSSFSPEVLLASGLFDPSRVAGIQQEIYNQQMSKLQQDLAPYLVTAAPEWGTTEQFFSYNRDASVLNDPVISDLLLGPEGFAKIRSGQITGEQLKNAIRKGIMEGQLPLTPDQFATIENAVDTFSKELPQFNANVARAQYEGAGKQSQNQAMIDALMANAPTERSAQLEFYRQIGMPQLALFPDITEQYQFDPTMFIEPGIIERTGTKAAKAQEIIAKELPGAQKLSKQAHDVKQYVGLRTRDYNATKAKEDYLAKNLPDLPTYQQWSKQNRGKDYSAYVSYAKQIKNEQKKVQAIANNIFKAAISKPVVTLAPEPGAISPALGEAQKALKETELVSRVYGQRGAAKAQELTNALTGAGITPFQQAMLQFFNVPGANKKKK